MEKKKIAIALAGNPNSGKSTIFNNLTGARQHVSNYPGVTVEKKEGKIIYKNYEITVVDLPGTYSLSAYSEDELVARNFIIEDQPDVVVDIIDASNLERNLYLATQLMELKTPLILAMNMSDIVKQRGQNIDYTELSELLGVAIVPTVGNKNAGTKELLETIVEVYEGKVKTKKVHVGYGPEVHEEMDKIEMILLKDKALIDRYPLRWLVIKMIENDSSVLDIVSRSTIGQEVKLQNEKSRHHLRLHFGDVPETIIADRRYGFISGACTQVTKQSIEQRHDLSDRID
ncbi:ferrous iron transporter B, partial [bacterium]|nr:ferrous iron transporter B [bacterium]